MNTSIKNSSLIYLCIKRIFDLTISIVALIILFPLLFIIGLAIKIESKGPVFFIQKRLGKDGKEFNIYKFRTMVNNAENIGTGIFVTESDSRITNMGKLLRSTSLDELPQLINVIKGDMSIVGPRPPLTHYPYVYEDYDFEEKQRFRVKPGITGYAQIRGRNNLTWSEKIKLDIFYIKNRNFIMDIKIIFITIFKVLKRDNIYVSDKK